MVIRQGAVSDQINLLEFNDIFCAILGVGRQFELHLPTAKTSDACNSTFIRSASIYWIGFTARCG